ncbi:MAG: SDR family oxidoreductase [Kyrpidia sp.]|nr:SDR family oxidoreductase [Kyrpidia sp.]
MDRLMNKIAIITGGASGQGKAASLLFAKEGATVIVADFDAEKGKKAVDEIIAQNGNAEFHHVDVTRESLVESLVKSVVAKYGRLDIMYNNAGLVKMRPIGELPTDDWDFTIRFELQQVYYGCKYALQQMEKKGYGVILNTASTSGLVGIPGHGPHAATKAGVIGLTRSIAVDYGPKGIRCNAVAPGFIPYTQQTGDLSNDEFIRMMLQAQPLKRHGRPEDVAQCALFLCSDEASWITGQVIAVDGGYTAM